MKCFSLFSGIGGFDLALTRQGHTMVGACEIDKYARSIYSRHFPGVKIHEDATKIKPEELPDFDILVAGFPCQTFSFAGKRLGFKDTRGTLFFEIARIAKERQPQYLLLENVKGLLFHDNQKTITTMLNTLEELGYEYEWQVINSKYFVPHDRERIFIIGHNRKKPIRKIFPLTNHYNQIIESSNNQVYALTVENSTANGRRIKGMNEPSYTLSRACAVDVIVDDEWRYFTRHELERLQGFPDDWTRGLGITALKNCIGNAVTVPVVEYIISHLTVQTEGKA